MDESYCWTNIHSEYGWGKAGETRLAKVNTGNRITIVDAMTRDEPLGFLEDSYKSLDFSTERLCSLLTFTHKARDFHLSWTGMQFLEWVRTRIIPLFERKYPGKKMVLIMDNASTHKLRLEGFIDF